MSSEASVLASPFGAQLRRWRQQRGLSQLRLAVEVGSTSRHVSFLETGRSRPSRQMVLRLCEALDVPLRERNALLHGAGLAAAYPQTPLGDPDLTPYRAAIDRLLHAHQPYPAMAVDARWNIVAANPSASVLFGADVVGANIVRRYLADEAAAQVIVNWSQVAWAGLVRLRHEAARAPFDDELRELVTLTERTLAGVPRPDLSGPEIMVCPWFRVGDEVVHTIGMVARFDPVAEVTLDELRIELTYPQDAAAERFFRAHAGSGPA